MVSYSPTGRHEDTYPTKDPWQQLQDYLNSLQAQQPDFNALAQQQLDPAYQAQLAAINSARDQAKKNAKYGDAQIAAMYAALGKDIGKNAGRLNSIYGASQGDVNNAYAQGLAGANSTYNQGQAAIQGMLDKFGIGAAAPDALAQSYKDQAIINGIMQANKQAATNSLSTSRTGDLAFNTEQQNISGLQGANTRSDLQQALQNALTGYNQQQIQATGNYNSQLAQRQYDLQQSYLQNLQSQQNMAYTMYNDQQDRALQQQQLQMQQNPTMSQQWNMMGPVDKGYYQASNLFGPENAGQAMNFVMTAVPNVSSYPTGFDFVQAVLAANSETAKTDPARALDPQKLMSLASFMYDQINPRYNPYASMG